MARHVTSAIRNYPNQQGGEHYVMTAKQRLIDSLRKSEKTHSLELTPNPTGKNMKRKANYRRTYIIARKLIEPSHSLVEFTLLCNQQIKPKQYVHSAVLAVWNNVNRILHSSMWGMWDSTYGLENEYYAQQLMRLDGSHDKVLIATAPKRFKLVPSNYHG